MNGSWRSGRLDAVLGGDFDLIAAREGECGSASYPGAARSAPSKA